MVLGYEILTVGWLWWRWLLWEARGLRSAGHAAGRVAMQVIRWSFSSTNQYKGHRLYIFPSMMIPFDIAIIIGCHASNCLHLPSNWSADGWRWWTHHHHHHRHHHPHHCQHHHHHHQPRQRLWWRFITIKWYMMFDLVRKINLWFYLVSLGQRRLRLGSQSSAIMKDHYIGAAIGDCPDVSLSLSFHIWHQNNCLPVWALTNCVLCGWWSRFLADQIKEVALQLLDKMEESLNQSRK